MALETTMRFHAGTRDCDVRRVSPVENQRQINITESAHRLPGIPAHSLNLKPATMAADCWLNVWHADDDAIHGSPPHAEPVV